MKKSEALIQRWLRKTGGELLDYGCGDGELLGLVGGWGHEPFMELSSTEGNIRRSLSDFEGRTFSLLSAFEVLEHLEEAALVEFFAFAKRVLRHDGVIVVSVPIEIGPALLAKELRRMQGRKWKGLEYKTGEFVKAVFWGIPGTRSPHINRSHAGFDFRVIVRRFETEGYRIVDRFYSPFQRWPTWYGNSQAFFVW